MSSDEQGVNELESELAEVKQSISQLEAEAYRLRDFLKNVPAAIYFKDKDSRFIMASDYLATTQGTDVAGLIGKTDHEFFKKEYADAARADEIRVMETGEPKIGDREHEYWSDEHDTWWFTHKLPLRDEHGNVTGTFGVSQNITREVMLEKEREKLIVQLQEALTEIKQLDGLMPICTYCKKIRDDKGYWQQMEEYISSKTEARFTHSMCEGCAEDYIRQLDASSLPPNRMSSPQAPVTTRHEPS